MVHGALSAQPPQVELGQCLGGGLAPAILAIVERGVRLRPAVAAELRGEVELDLGHAHPPVRIRFDERSVLVEDGSAKAPILRVSGTLGDLTALMVTPLIGGVPSPMRARGRTALGNVAFGRLRVKGRVRLLRRLLALIRI
jgi:hypothetical protein